MQVLEIPAKNDHFKSSKVNLRVVSKTEINRGHTSEFHWHCGGTLAALSWHSRGTVAALSRHCGGTLVALWRHSRGTLAALSCGTLMRHSRGTVMALSWHCHGTLVFTACSTCYQPTEQWWIPVYVFVEDEDF